MAADEDHHNDPESPPFLSEPKEEEPLSGTVTEGRGSGARASSRGLALPGDILPVDLPILPVYGRPMFPVQSVPVVLPEEPWLQTLIQLRDAGQSMVGLVMVRDGADARPSGDASGSSLGDPTRRPPPPPSAFHEVGTAAVLHQATRKDGTVQFVAEGRQRFRINRWLSDSPPLAARVTYPENVLEPNEDELRAYAMAIIGVIKKLIPLNPLYNEELKQFLQRFTPQQPAFLADFAANLTSAGGSELQAVLETFDVLERMRTVLALLHKELEVVQLQAQIRSQVEQSMTEQQRKFFLSEQLKVIQKELGISKDDRTADVERFRERLGALVLGDEASARVEEELAKLSVLETGSPEYGVTRNYLDWVTNLPWGRVSPDNLDLAAARAQLDADHAGLDEVKERIIEFLAVGRLRGAVTGSIVLLVGPPGVGKTSIGRSVATALGRQFYRFSLGGMRDEAEIKGHRRTYIGAMPGKFIQAIKSAGTANPVIMLDEIDKVGASYHGDPASALLEVLDPEQNSEFLDHYLDLRFDLSQTLFVCTANQLDTIPQPLLDRMEVIRLAGYVAEEKLAIAKRHLWPRVLERAGLNRARVRISDAALRRTVEQYAREAGVRGLEKQLGRIARKAAVEIVGETPPSAGGEDQGRRPGKRAGNPIRVTGKNLEHYLGRPPFNDERPMRGVGIITGLAWTPMGGATLNIEATIVHSKRRGFNLTGNLGDVMKESAEIAYGHIAGNLERYGVDAELLDDAQVHLHVPEGATPKDGPSAGISMASALVSLVRGRPPRPGQAMTGELTLTGAVLGVGGIREKVIAARRVGIKSLVLPEANRRDFDNLPEHLRAGLDVVFASHFEQVAESAFA